MSDKIEAVLAIGLIVLPIAFWAAIGFLIVHFVVKLW